MALLEKKKKYIEREINQKPAKIIYKNSIKESLDDQYLSHSIKLISKKSKDSNVESLPITKRSTIKVTQKPEDFEEDYIPILNSNSVLEKERHVPETGYLRKENYLSEFKTEEDKAKARANLGIDRVGSDASDVTYSVEGKDFKNVEDALNALFYVKIAITYFSASPSEAEIGELINTVTFSWNVNKDKYTQSINSEPLDVSIKSISESNVTTNITKTLEVTDGLTSDSRRASITFKLGKYYGVFNTSPSSEEIINSFKRNLNLSKGNEITVTAGSQDHIYIMVPLSMKDLRFSVGGFEGGFHIINEHYQFIRYGKTFDNVLFESDEPGLGTTKIKLL